MSGCSVVPMHVTRCHVFGAEPPSGWGARRLTDGDLTARRGRAGGEPSGT